MIGSSDNPASAADLARRRVVYADAGRLRDDRGVEVQVFENYPARFTALVHLSAGGLLPPDSIRRGTEILVFEGQVEFEGVPLGRHGYARAPTRPDPVVTATTEAILFVKRGHIPLEDDFETVLEPRPELWKARQAGELQTLALHHHRGIAVSLMRYQPGTAAVARRRSGGEEILILDGTLLDERSAYPRGSWIRNPPGSLHEPFSVEGCLIYLQTGHLPIL